MAQRPSFDMNKLTTADKILGGGALLLFIDSFLPWQRACVGVTGSFRFCVSASAWTGNGGWAGILMAIAAIALVIAIGLTVAGVAMPPTVPMPTVMTGLTAATVVLGALKFILALTNNPGFGSWVGIVLIVAVAYGGYMKMQEPKAAMPPSTPPPPAPGPTDFTT
jgi:hypothetical protein